MVMDLHPTLEVILNALLQEELDRMLNQGTKIESAIFFHQVKMEELCYSIKAHDHWVRYGEHFPFTIHCNLCGEAISLEFDRERHRGRCSPSSLTHPVTSEACHSTAPCV